MVDNSTVAQLEAMLARMNELDIMIAEKKEQTQQAIKRRRKAQVELMTVQSVNKGAQKKCRDLQQCTKTLQEEAQRLHDDSVSRRSNLTGKFDKTIDDITQKMSEQVLEVQKVVDENSRLRERLSKFEEQYGAAKKHWETEAHAKLLERRLAHARLLEAEERFHQRRLGLVAYMRQVNLMGEAEEAQQQQAAKYKERLGELSDALAKNAVVFSGYASRAQECDARTAQLLESSEQLRLKVNGFDEKRAALRSRCDAEATKLAEAIAQRDSLGTDIRALQAARATFLATQRGCDGQASGSNAFSGDQATKVSEDELEGRS